jgi:hypothetical protein
MLKKKSKCFVCDIAQVIGLARTQVLMVASIKMTVFRDDAPYSLIAILRRFGGGYCLNHQGHRPGTVRYVRRFEVLQFKKHERLLYSFPDDRSSKHLWNVDQLLRYYMAKHPRIQLSSSLVLLSIYCRYKHVGGTGTGFYPSSPVSPVDIIPPLLHARLSPLHGVCDNSDHAAHYHTLSPKLRASSVTRHLARTEEKHYLFYINMMPQS